MDDANVLGFSNARAVEISRLMECIDFKKNKTAFQSLPPHMRRRSASHNPKRVPRKLRESYLIQNPHATSKPKKASKKIRKKIQKKKHESQAKNYPEEYASRSRPGEIWLETHIWHAKRCKMVNLWGYKLPLHCNDKKLGATHQAATKHAMLQDLSYYGCIELEGPENKLIKCLSCLTNPESGFHFGSEMYLDGTKEGHTFIYYPNKFPYKGIGYVTFIWRPLSNIQIDNVRKLWIWCHPAFYDELVDVLVGVFQLKEVDSTPNNSSDIKVNNEDIQNESSAEKEELTFASKVNFAKTKQHFLKEIKYVNDNVQMYLLKNKLVRYRLIGPNAQSVLLKVLDIAKIESKNEIASDPIHTELNMSLKESKVSSIETVLESSENFKKRKLIPINDVENVSNGPCKKMKIDTLTNGDNSEITSDEKVLERSLNELMGVKKDLDCQLENDHSSSKKIKLCKLDCEEIEPLPIAAKQVWWQSYYEKKCAITLHKKKIKLLEYLRNGRSNYYISPGTVIGLTVRDPRLILSQDKKSFTSADDSDIGKSLEENFTPEGSDSPIWDADIRSEVTRTQIPESEINKKRHENLSHCDNSASTNQENKVPILLIHQPGINGYGSGWDLIAPLGWGMTFWIPLILNGGRATGLRDLHFVNLETGHPSFPMSYPDTKAGISYEEMNRMDELTTYFKRPKAKRPNFTTFATLNPFFMPWDILLKDWLTELNKEQKSIFFPLNNSEDGNISVQELDGDVDFFVSRQNENRLLQNLCNRLSMLPKGPKLQKVNNSCFKQMFNELVQSCLTSQKQFSNAIVLIRLKCLTRGCPTNHSGIYALNDSDIEQFKNIPNYLGPVEPNHTQRKTNSKPKDLSTDSKSKDLSTDFKSKDLSTDSMPKDLSADSKLKDLSTDSKQKDLSATSKPNDVNSSSENENSKLSPNKKIDEDKKLSPVERNNKISCNNQVKPEDLVRPQIKSLKSCSSREMIGYLSEGGFSSIMGKGCGIGHCSFVGMLFMLKKCIDSLIPPLVLIREQHSFQYRVSMLEIIPNYI